MIEIDDESEEEAAKLSEKIEMISARIKRIQSSIENATGRIHTVLTLAMPAPYILALGSTTWSMLEFYMVLKLKASK